MLLTEKTLTETLFPCRLKVEIHNNSNTYVQYNLFIGIVLDMKSVRHNQS